jgi:hypothetical protein
MEVQGLATHTEVCDMMRTAATGPTRAATVAKALSAISQRVEELEERANPSGGRLAEDLPVTIRRRRCAERSTT